LNVARHSGRGQQTWFLRQATKGPPQIVQRRVSRTAGFLRRRLWYFRAACAARRQAGEQKRALGRCAENGFRHSRQIRWYSCCGRLRRTLATRSPRGQQGPKRRLGRMERNGFPQRSQRRWYLRARGCGRFAKANEARVMSALDSGGGMQSGCQQKR
jgi:hypothetical protein